MPGGGFIDITITGEDGVELMRRRVATWGLRLTDHTEPLTEIGGDLLQDFASNFVTEGGTFAHRWAPLAPSTVQEKSRLGYGGGALVRTGYMLNSLTLRGAPGNVFEVTPHSLVTGTSDPVAGFHQRGHSSPTRLPQRRVVGWSWERRQGVVRRFNEWVQRMLEQS